MAFSAVWVAEQLKYFEQEGVRAKITPASGARPVRTPWSAARPIFAEGLVLAQIEGAPLIAIQAHNRNLTLSIALRRAITDKFKVTRASPLNDRIRVLTELSTIGATSPGAVSEQLSSFWCRKRRRSKQAQVRRPRRHRIGTRAHEQRDRCLGAIAAVGGTHGDRRQGIGPASARTWRSAGIDQLSL